MDKYRGDLLQVLQGQIALVKLAVDKLVVDYFMHYLFDFFRAGIL